MKLKQNKSEKTKFAQMRAMRKITRRIQLLAILLVIPVSGGAFAQVTSYTQEKFDAAQKRGETVIVGVHADWCPTCRKQKPIIETLSKQKEFQKAVFFRVNMDQDKEFLKRFNVTTQSTLIVFKGKREIARSAGETSQEKIKELFLKGM